MFSDSKYTKWYYSIINNARGRQVVGYKERHHIIPRSFGGQDDVANLVDLTAREHLLCHLLLVKMSVGSNKYKMACAVMRMSKGNTLKSRSYHWVKTEFGKMVSAIKRGKPLSEEHKSKIGDSIRGRKQTREWIKKRTSDVWTDRQHSSVSRAKMSESHRGIRRVGWNQQESTKAKLSAWQAANSVTRGTRWWNNGDGVRKRAVCAPGPGWALGR
jgi:hypothetical protein